MLKWIKNLFWREPYKHPLADEREELADKLRALSFLEGCRLLEELAETNFPLYASWMTETYPSVGDNIYPRGL